MNKKNKSSILSDDQLDKVSGGKDVGGGDKNIPQMMWIECWNCHRKLYVNVQLDQVECKKSEGGCGETIELKG